MIRDVGRDACGLRSGCTLTAAAEHVQAGRSQALMDVKLPLPFVVTAGGYIEKYGPDERYNFLKFLEHVPCPTLITFGSNELEPHMAFRGLPEALAPIAATHRRMQVEIIAAADHFYTGARAELLARVESWLLAQVDRSGK